MPRSATVHTCSACGHQSPKWHGRCPGCGEWNVMVEEATPAAPARAANGTRTRSGAAAGSRALTPVALADVAAPRVERLRTGIGELDRVLGGGPPHFWSLAIRYRDDYANAGVPMLPVVASLETVGQRIVSYAYVMVATSLALPLVAGTGWFYPVAAAALGAAFLVEAHLLLARTRGTEDVAVVEPMRLFHGSNLYLALLFLSVALDPLITHH